MNKYKVDWAYLDSSEYEALLEGGWEPFAVTRNFQENRFRVWFRKLEK